MATNSFESVPPTRVFERSERVREESFFAFNSKELSNQSNEWISVSSSSRNPMQSLSIVVRGTAISAPRNHWHGRSAAASEPTTMDDRSCVRYTLTDQRKHRAVRVIDSRDMQSYFLTDYDLKEVLDERGVVVSVSTGSCRSGGDPGELELPRLLCML
ncbi:Iwr1 domain-containing protein [Mycena chlorophos]|uniref:Iwr1 domain-containing protein n=1 Tax=Mycena chlorophos TaxID=658473 RepID=A0A8H6SD17_MYCCL|nr:Iwr1 domain-containing protein [Mycena chlorophos]